MDVHLPLLQRCFQEAAAASGRALERCIDQSLATLEAAEGSTLKLAERDNLAAARVGLLAQRDTWGAQYTAALLAAFNPLMPVAAEATEPATLPATLPAPAALDSSRPALDGLSLVDDAQIEQDIAFARLATQLRSQVEPVMADLDALVCAAQGLTRVLPERNALRPEVFAGALRGLLNGAAVAPEIRALWLRGMAAPLGAELRKIYDVIIARLNGANVQAVSYRWVANASGAAAGQGAGRAGGWRVSGGPDSGGGNDPGGAWPDGGDGDVGYSVNPLSGNTDALWAGPSQSGVNPSLYRHFLVNGVDNRARLDESYYVRIDEELEALRAETEPASGDPQVDMLSGETPLTAPYRPQRCVDGQSLLNARVWGDYARARTRKLARAELRREATHVGQVLALEVVRKLVNEVAQDPRLMVAVREAIVALEPSLGRLALVDPQFFSDESHPGRRLMERVAQRSFRYKDEESSGFPEFVDSLRRSFTALNALKIDSAEPFSSALATLEAAWAERDREGEVRSHDVQHGLRFAEERQALADQIAFDMGSRPDLDKVPRPVLDFLFGPWSLVMAHARLLDTDRQIDPQGLGRLVSDLVWSVKRDFTLRQPGRLMQMIPEMVGKLNAGLDLIGQDPKERKAFLDLLMRLHRPVLKLRRLKSERDAQALGAHSQEAELLPATPEQRLPKAAAQPWLAPHELDNAGFEDSLPAGTGEPAAEAGLETAAGSGAEPAQPAVAGASRSAPLAQSVAGGSENPAQDAEQVERVLAGLCTGCWVDLFSRQRWRRAQLVWSSIRGTLFMFLSHGGRPHSMTRRRCERLIVLGLLRPVETHGVVARALSALTNEVQATDVLPLNPARATPSNSNFAQLA